MWREVVYNNKITHSVLHKLLLSKGTMEIQYPNFVYRITTLRFDFVTIKAHLGKGAIIEWVNAGIKYKFVLRKLVPHF